MNNMEKDNLKKRMEQGFAELTPDCWDDIKRMLPANAQEEKETVPFSSPRKSFARKWIPVIAAAAIVVICVLAFLLRSADKVAAVVYLDVNPSVSISINSKGDVVKVEGINEDGSRVVESAREKIGNGKDLDTVVREILAEIDAEGYFSGGSVDVLVSLCYMQNEDAVVLEQTCSSIETYAQTKGLKSNISPQSFAKNETDEAEAASLGISAGKYEFIVSLVDQGEQSKDSILELSKKSAGELIECSKGTETATEPASEPESEKEKDKDDKAKNEENIDKEKQSGNKDNPSSENSNAGKKKDNSSSNGKDKSSKEKNNKQEKSKGSEKKNNSNNKNKQENKEKKEKENGKKKDKNN